MLSSLMARWRRHGAVQMVVAGLGLVLLASFLVGAYQKAYRPEGYDLHSYLNPARALVTGANPYAIPSAAPYTFFPLFPCAAVIPLTFLPDPLVHGAWFLACLAAWAGAAALLVGRLPAAAGVGWDRGLLLPLTAGCLLLFGAIQNHLLNAQTNAFVLLLCVLFWVDWHKGRSGRAALWLALGISIKLVPLLFFVPLLARRSWTVLGLTCAWVVVLCVALPAVFLGAGVFPAYEYYARNVLMVEWHASAFSERYAHFYSVHGMLTWLAPAWRAAPAAKAVAVLAVLLPLGAAEWRGTGASRWRRLALLEVYLAGILLLTPVSEPHHLTFLLPGAWLLTLRWSAAPGRPLWAELLDLAPYALIPLWKVVGGPVEFLAVAWLFVAALVRAAGMGREDRVAVPAPVTAAPRQAA